MFREATIMVLYVSVVEIAELAAMPERLSHGHVSGPVSIRLLSILWGTALGLALAHCFAFQVAAPVFRGEHFSSDTTRVVLAQLLGAVFVAAVTSLPLVVMSDLRGRESVAYIPALIIGFVGYLGARRASKSHLAAVFYGITALALGVLVALIKNVLASH
jgi:hypothetical protein